MKVTWLGQAGLIFQKKELCIMVDPYLSDSVKKINPNNFRRCPVDKSIFDIAPNVILITHNHMDHYDTETLKVFFEKYSDMTVLAPFSTWKEIRKFGGKNNYVMFNAHTRWTMCEVEFIGINAVHSDPDAIGCVICADRKNYYIAGDTLYSSDVTCDVKKLTMSIDVAFVPINGVGNNMNMLDAEKFVKEINAKAVVPVHFGMFDEINPNEFSCKNKIIPEIYKEIVL